MAEPSLIVDTTQRIFRELGDPQGVRDPVRRQRLWSALNDAGLTRAWLDESLNGSGASLSDGFDVLRVAGGRAVSVPLAETLLASWLLGCARIAALESVLTIAPTRLRDRVELTANGRLSGRASAIPFAREATHAVVLADRGSRTLVSLVEIRGCKIEESTNLAGDACDSIEFQEINPVTTANVEISRDDFFLMAAAVRATQMAGALQTVLDLTVAYANERVAFEKPIGKFQAIQHTLAKLAGEAAAALAAAGSAADALATSSKFDDAVFLEVASAKIRVGEAVTTGAAIAHQVHGAIGFSREHVLHRYTQRLWAWRDDFGSETEWAVKLGQHVARNGADALWPALAAR